MPHLPSSMVSASYSSFPRTYPSGQLYASANLGNVRLLSTPGVLAHTPTVLVSTSGLDQVSSQGRQLLVLHVERVLPDRLRLTAPDRHISEEPNLATPAGSGDADVRDRSSPLCSSHDFIRTFQSLGGEDVRFLPSRRAFSDAMAVAEASSVVPLFHRT